MRAKKPKLGVKEGVQESRIRRIEAMMIKRMKNQLEKHLVITSFAEIGLIDPFSTKKKGEDALNTLSSFEIMTDIYPENIIDQDMLTRGKKFKPSKTLPKMIFLPHKNLLRTMVRAILKYGTEPEHAFLMRFGIIEDMSIYTV